MSTRNGDGGPAYPREDYQGDYAPGQRGMSLCDYFAAAALPIAAAAVKNGETPLPEGVTIGQHIAACAYAIAQRMVDESAK